jgi:hypothetical protein
MPWKLTLLRGPRIPGRDLYPRKKAGLCGRHRPAQDGRRPPRRRGQLYWTWAPSTGPMRCGNGERSWPGSTAAIRRCTARIYALLRAAGELDSSATPGLLTDAERHAAHRRADRPRRCGSSAARYRAPPPEKNGASSAPSAVWPHPAL